VETKAYKNRAAVVVTNQAVEACMLYRYNGSCLPAGRKGYYCRHNDNYYFPAGGEWPENEIKKNEKILRAHIPGRLVAMSEKFAVVAQEHPDSATWFKELYGEGFICHE